MRGGRILDSENSPPRAWSAHWREGGCARWSTAIDSHVRLVPTGDWEGGRTDLECAADAEDAVVGLLGRQTLDSLLDGLALLGDQVIEPRKGSATGWQTKGPAGDIRRTKAGKCNTAAMAAVTGGGFGLRIRNRHSVFFFNRSRGH